MRREQRAAWAAQERHQPHFGAHLQQQAGRLSRATIRAVAVAVRCTVLAGLQLIVPPAAEVVALLRLATTQAAAVEMVLVAAVVDQTKQAVEVLHQAQAEESEEQGLQHRVESMTRQPE